MRDSVLILTAKHLSSLLPDSKCWHGSVQNSERYFGWCLPGITRCQCLCPCQRMVLIRTVAWCFEQAWERCFSSFSFGVLRGIVCIHLMCRKAASNLPSAETPAARRALVQQQHLTEPTAPPCVVVGLSLPLPGGARSVGEPVTARLDGC